MFFTSELLDVFPSLASAPNFNKGCYYGSPRDASFYTIYPSSTALHSRGVDPCQSTRPSPHIKSDPPLPLILTQTLAHYIVLRWSHKIRWGTSVSVFHPTLINPALTAIPSVGTALSSVGSSRTVRSRSTRRLSQTSLRRNGLRSTPTRLPLPPQEQLPTPASIPTPM